MRLFLRDLMDRFDQLSLRERGLVLAALVAFIVLVWDNLFMRPLERTRKQHLQQVTALRAEVAGLEKSAETIVAQASKDPDADTRAALAATRKEIVQIDDKLAGATSGLIAPKEMAHVLEQVLARTSELQLRVLRTLPPEPVAPATALPDASGKAASPAGPVAQIYKHGLEIELAGSYLDVLHFLQALESLPWHFFWEHVDFTVEQYPQGKLRLKLYTLGLQQGWIGV
jgi:MSHA biogenesis protein MshJ